MATKKENKATVNTTETKDEYKVNLVEANGLSESEILNNMNTDVLEQLSSLVGSLPITVKGYLHLEIHNPYVNKDDGGEEDYQSFVIVTEQGDAYYTSSQSFISSYKQIVTVREQLGMTGNVRIEVVEKKSKNNQGAMLLAKSAVE